MTDGLAYEWEPIEDLPDDWARLANPQLPVLQEVWQEQKGELEESGALRRFHERLRREWSIETGIIERLYTLPRGITEILIERGVDTSLIPHGSTDKDPELVVAIIHDHEEAIDWLFEIVKDQRPLSTSFVRELHALMTRHQATATGKDQFGTLVEVPLSRGTWKLQPNNPTRPDGTVHEYCPPEHVASEMDRLAGLHEQHISSGVPAEVEGAWIHHRFTQIHPFQDGNGRVARAVTSLVFLRCGWFPLVVTDKDRESYIGALEQADSGDLTALVELFARLQKKAFNQALSIGGDSLREGERLDQVISSIADIFSDRRDIRPPEWELATALSERVVERAVRRMEALGDQLVDATGQTFSVFAQHNNGERSQWYRAETESVARRLGYFANHLSYRAWVRLKLVTDTDAFVLLSLTGLGRKFRGVNAASLCFYRREVDEESTSRVVGLEPASDELFQVSYNEAEVSVERRFDDWLERGLTYALDMWRRGLPESPY